MSPTMLCSTGLHSTFLPALGWFLGAPMIRMLELRPEEMNTPARGQNGWQQLLRHLRNYQSARPPAEQMPMTQT